MVQRNVPLQTCAPCLEGRHQDCRVPSGRALCRCKVLENHGKVTALADDLLNTIESYIDAKLKVALDEHVGKHPTARTSKRVETTRERLKSALDRLR